MYLLQQSFRLQRQAGREIFLETGTRSIRWTSCSPFLTSLHCPCQEAVKEVRRLTSARTVCTRLALQGQPSYI